MDRENIKPALIVTENYRNNYDRVFSDKKIVKKSIWQRIWEVIVLIFKKVF